MTETLLCRSVRRLFAGGGAIGPILLAQLLIQPQAQAQEVAARPVARVVACYRRARCSARLALVQRSLSAWCGAHLTAFPAQWHAGHKARLHSGVI